MEFTFNIFGYSCSVVSVVISTIIYLAAESKGLVAGLFLLFHREPPSMEGPTFYAMRYWMHSNGWLHRCP